MDDGLTFEQTLSELERIVEQLQRPDVPLEEAVRLYQRGTELARRSEEMLSGAELQVRQLTSAVQERFARYEVEEDVIEEAIEE